MVSSFANSPLHFIIIVWCEIDNELGSFMNLFNAQLTRIIRFGSTDGNAVLVRTF